MSAQCVFHLHLAAVLLAAPLFAADTTDAVTPASTSVERETSLPALRDLPSGDEPATRPLEPDSDEGDLEDDEPDAEEPAAQSATSRFAELPRHPDDLVQLARQDVAALGSLSLGTPGAGLLVNPVPMPEGALWTIRDPRESYGTAETVQFIETAIRAVEAEHPGSPRLVIGDISRPDGGRLNRHRSHQAGRDVDLGFYYLQGENGRFEAARAGALDLARNWALVRALVTQTDVERIFLDRSLIRILHDYAVEQGEDPEWVRDVFGRGHEKGVVQHVKRHKDHLHVRFFSPLAQETGRVVYATLVERGAVPPPLVRHRVRRGETLGHVAARYGVSAASIRSANRLRGSLLRAGRSYVVPIRTLPRDAGPLVFPARRLPRFAAPRASEAQLGSAVPQGSTVGATP